jgi:hypothetical protein
MLASGYLRSASRILCISDPLKPAIQLNITFQREGSITNASQCLFFWDVALRPPDISRERCSLIFKGRNVQEE